MSEQKTEMPDLDFPERLTLELTNNCNLNCVMCPRDMMAKNMGYMDMQLVQKILDEAASHLPLTLVPFFRGESLLHPHFFEIIAMAKERGLGPVQLTTNAMLLDDELSSKLIETGLDFISFSLDVLGKETYEKIRVGGDYEKVTANIESFIAKKESIGAEKPEIQVSTVETAENTVKLREFVGHWIEKVDRVRVYPEHSTDGSFGSLDKYKLPDFEKRLPCRKVFTDMVIYWNGDVAVCNHDWDRKEHIGNVGESSISDIWHSDKYKEIRKRHMEGLLDNDPTCSGCDHWKMYYLQEGFIGELYERSS